MIPNGIVDNEEHMRLFDKDDVLNSICKECVDCDVCKIRYACEEARKSD